MKRLTATLWKIMLAMLLPLTACSNNDLTETDLNSFNVDFTLPSLIEVTQGGTYAFSCQEQKAHLHPTISWLNHPKASPIFIR